MTTIQPTSTDTHKAKINQDNAAAASSIRRYAATVAKIAACVFAANFANALVAVGVIIIDMDNGAYYSQADTLGAYSTYVYLLAVIIAIIAAAVAYPEKRRGIVALVKRNNA